MARAKARAGLSDILRLRGPPCWWAPAPASYNRLDGQVITAHGFLAARSRSNPKLVLHIQHVEFEKGN